MRVAGIICVCVGLGYLLLSGLCFSFARGFMEGVQEPFPSSVELLLMSPSAIFVVVGVALLILDLNKREKP